MRRLFLTCGTRRRLVAGLMVLAMTSGRPGPLWADQDREKTTGDPKLSYRRPADRRFEYRLDPDRSEPAGRREAGRDTSRSAPHPGNPAGRTDSSAHSDDSPSIDAKAAHGPRLSDQPIPLMDSDALNRPEPLLELGDPFLGSGPIQRGVEVPGGGVLQPSLLVFGTYRTAVQSFHDGEETATEWANRLDLFANLQFTGTERLLAGFRPLDEDGVFTGYHFEGEPTGWREAFDAEPRTLFFEGDLGEILPGLDPRDRERLDLGFSVGRQPLFYQEGLLINDDVDAIGITRNTLKPRGTSNFQGTLLYGWNEIHRDDNREADDAQMIGLFTETDFPQRTINADFVYVFDEDRETDGVYWGVSSVQRIGRYNTALRLLGSHALEEESAAVSSGYLLFSEVSWSPPHTHDLVYVDGFVGVDEFSSAARGPATGGPLGRTGILFAAVGLGRYGAPLGNRADESVGGAIGYQMFFDEERRQIILELGGRAGTGGEDEATAALGARYQQALDRHWVLRMDAFGSLNETRGAGYGGRLEMRYQF